MKTDTLAPNFDIELAGANIDTGLRQLIQSVEYESADGMADIAKLRLSNPNFILTDVKAMQPGNEMSIYMGYGSRLQHIGRVVINKQEPVYPDNDMPFITITGMTKDSKMMENAPEKSKKVKGKGGRSFANATYTDAVMERANDYGMSLDIDHILSPTRTFIQKAGLSDYDFVKGLSNITGYLFWVDWNPAAKKWVLHFKDPETLVAQENVYTFRYNLGDMTSLLSFSPQLLLQGLQTKLKVQVKDLKTGRLIDEEVEEDNDESPDVVATDTVEEIDKPHTTGSDIKLFIEDYSFDIITNRRFSGPTAVADVKAWARQWFRRQRENFIMARGKAIGLETLMARQIHKIEGVSKGLDGQYYFSRVKHQMSSDGGYTCDFNARKVVPKI